MTASTILDLGESWIRSNPEIEVFTTSSGAVHCSGDHSRWPRYFDQNSNDWTGAVLLLDSAEAYRYREGNDDNLYPLIQIWENDHDSCEINTNRDLRVDTENLLVSGAVLYFTVKCDPKYYGNGGWCPAGWVAGATGVLVYGHRVLFNDDDLVGFVQHNASWEGHTNALRRYREDPKQNGGITLRYR
jgi:hypothetical protein